MLDELGVKAGCRRHAHPARRPPLKITLDLPGRRRREHKRKDNQLSGELAGDRHRRDQQPDPPAGWNDQWWSGKMMGNSDWEIGDGPNHLVYPQWLVPIETTRWAPLQGSWYRCAARRHDTEELDQDPWERTPPRLEPEKGGPIEQLWDIYDQPRSSRTR